MQTFAIIKKRKKEKIIHHLYKTIQKLILEKLYFAYY